jgi:dTDP-4-dehydrorhamnose reductase
VWALLGSWDWCNLVTCDRGMYEPGVFHLADPNQAPSPTPLAGLVQQLASGAAPPSAGRTGWWSRPERLLFPSEPTDPSRSAHDRGSEIEEGVPAAL